jgi:hypothetical protein
MRLTSTLYDVLENRPAKLGNTISNVAAGARVPIREPHYVVRLCFELWSIGYPDTINSSCSPTKPNGPVSPTLNRSIFLTVQNLAQREFSCLIRSSGKTSVSSSWGSTRASNGRWQIGDATDLQIRRPSSDGQSQDVPYEFSS